MESNDGRKYEKKLNCCKLLMTERAPSDVVDSAASLPT